MRDTAEQSINSFHREKNATHHRRESRQQRWQKTEATLALAAAHLCLSDAALSGDGHARGPADHVLHHLDKGGLHARRTQTTPAQRSTGGKNKWGIYLSGTPVRTR